MTIETVTILIETNGELATKEATQEIALFPLLEALTTLQAIVTPDLHLVLPAAAMVNPRYYPLKRVWSASSSAEAEKTCVVSRIKLELESNSWMVLKSLEHKDIVKSLETVLLEPLQKPRSSGPWRTTT
jgi:hypothetical protein